MMTSLLLKKKSLKHRLKALWGNLLVVLPIKPIMIPLAPPRNLRMNHPMNIPLIPPQILPLRMTNLMNHHQNLTLNNPRFHPWKLLKRKRVSRVLHSNIFQMRLRNVRKQILSWMKMAFLIVVLSNFFILNLLRIVSKLIALWTIFI
jgi:hypothetical protein